MSDLPVNLPFPLAELHCKNCKPQREGKATSTTLYNRSSMRVSLGCGRRSYFIDVEVDSIDRAFDKDASAYVVHGIFKIRCPKCKKNHIETRELVRIPLRLLTELVTCETCWKPCQIIDSTTSFKQQDDDVDMIIVRGLIRCKTCHTEKPINKNESIAAIEMLRSYSANVRESSSEQIPFKSRDSLEVFFSYSHQDEKLRDELEKHLSLLKNEGVISAWYDRRITAGSEWRGQIDEHLDTADVILLLISADFLASTYCYDVELHRAMERHESGEACVIPIILRAVDWQGARFGELQALPKDGKPVTVWDNCDEAFTDIAKGVRAAIAERKSKRGETKADSLLGRFSSELGRFSFE